MVETPLILALNSEPAWATQWVPSQPGLYSESLSKKANQTKKEKKKVMIIKWNDLTVLKSMWLTWHQTYMGVYSAAGIVVGLPFFHVFSCTGLLKYGGCFSLSLREEREAQQIGERLLMVNEKWLLNIGDGSSDLGAFNRLDRDLCSYRHWAVGLESASFSQQLG